MNDENILEVLTSIDATLKELIAVNKMKDKKVVVNMPQLARRLNTTTTFLLNHPWLMPNLGKSDYPGNRKWDVETVEAWLSRPIEERREAWAKMCDEEVVSLKNKVLGG